jgi:hypothetical protein
VQLDDWDKGCAVCGTRKIDGRHACPVCGWEPPEALFDEPEEQHEKVHLSGCHDDMECRFTKVTIYKHPWLVAHRKTKIASFECFDDYLLEWTIRCPICGEVFEVEDRVC